MISKICGFTALVFATNCMAEQNIKIMALFQDKAIVTIDGHRQKLEIGKQINGITLIEANSKQAVVKINDETRVLKLGSGAINIESKQQGEVIFKNKSGMFFTQTSLNGSMPIDAVIDTGAVAVAISRKMADEIHLDYHSGRQLSASTANGRVNTQLINLASIKVGKIELKNVPTLVSDGEMQHVLLGMTFLNRLRLVNSSDSLTLLEK